MTAAEGIEVSAEADAVPLRDLERELARKLREVTGPDASHAHLARMSNLLLYCEGCEQAERLAEELPGVMAVHPARILFLVAEPQASGEMRATVQIMTRQATDRQPIYLDLITLNAPGETVAHLPFAMRWLLVGDLPTNLWWAVASPPPLAGHLLYDLAEHGQQVIYDSLGWKSPSRGIAATASWLCEFEGKPGHVRWRVASDLNWRRLRYWRRILTQALDPTAAPGALESIKEITVEHGPHAVTQAWQLIGWLAARLGWRVDKAHVQPGVEMDWQVRAATGKLNLRIRRLSEGPAEVRLVHIACTIGGKATEMRISVEDEKRLAVTVGDGTARTVTVQPQTLAEMVGRQLSDREPDPVFRESMAVAQVFAQSVLA